MKTVIEYNDKKVKFLLPTKLGLNRITCRIIWKKLKQENVDTKYRDLIKFMKCCLKYRKRNKSWNILEIESEGKRIIVKI